MVTEAHPYGRPLAPKTVRHVATLLYTSLAEADLRIPVKWATDSAGKWAGVRRASRRGKDMMTQVARLGQEG